jgi:hypothetical protein
MTRSRLARRSWPALLITVFLTACGGSTTTPAVDAQQVQQRLDQFVAMVTKPQPGSEVVVKAEGKAKVETKDDGTVVGSLPRLSVKGEDGNTAVLDPITFRFANGGDGKVNFEAVLPSALQVKKPDGSVEGEVKIGSQSLKGVWIEKLQTLDDVDMRLSNITITSPSEAGSGKIDEIAMTGKLEPKGSGVYDGKYDFKLTGFSVDDPAEKTTVKMASIGVVARMTGARLEAWAQAAKEAGYTLSNPELFKVWTGGPLDPKVVAFMKRMPEYMGAIDYVYAIDGIDVAQEGKAVFSLKTTSLGFGVAPDGKGTTKLKMSMCMGGMSGGPDAPMLPPEADVQNATMEIEATGVPGQKLWEIYVDSLPELQAAAAKAAGDTATGQGDVATAGSAAVEQVGAELSGKFLEVLTAAKLAVALNKLDLLTPTAKMTGKGAATYLPAEGMPEGKVTLRFSGVDALAKAMQKRGPQDEMAQNIMGALAGITAMGKPDPASPANDRAYIIEIQFSKDGKILMNGQDMMGVQ